MRAEPDMWKHEPFGDVIPIPYRATFDAAQFERLKNGLIPRQMEDKWFVYFEDRQLLFHRSWTGQAVYRVILEDRGIDHAVTDAECASHVADNNGPEYHAQLLDFLVRNLLLGEATPFPRPQGLSEPLPGVLQHHISGTGYPERVLPKPPPKTPWWRFWS